MTPDPDRMIALLQHNPYHISTLLQVSEILCQQRDYNASGDLLERALFAFGRSLHSTFTPLLTNPSFSSGKIKHPQLCFTLFPNREFFLACWRYIHNLTLRGTFRAASEFARLLFSLAPERDPYAMLLYLPIIFLKAHQPNLVISLANSPTLSPHTQNLPGIAYSVPLAYHQLGNPLTAREYLAKAIRKFPWIATRLWQELDLDTSKIPKTLWGRLPPENSQVDKIITELYIEHSRDLWNTPDATRLLMDVAAIINNIPPAAKKNRKTNQHDEIIDGVPASIARHVILSGIPSVTTLLPSGWKDRLTTDYDPLPPSDAVNEYDMFSGVAEVGMPFGPSELPAFRLPPGIGGTVMELFRTLLPWTRPEPAGGGVEGGAEPSGGTRHPIDWNRVFHSLDEEDVQQLRQIIRERAAEITTPGVDQTGDEDEEGFRREIFTELLQRRRGDELEPSGRWYEDAEELQWEWLRQEGEEGHEASVYEEAELEAVLRPEAEAEAGTGTGTGEQTAGEHRDGSSH